MTTEQIKAKAAEKYPEKSSSENPIIYGKRMGYVDCYEQNCLPIQKENELMRNALLELKKMYERSEWIVNIIEVAISEGNGVASEK